MESAVIALLVLLVVLLAALLARGRRRDKADTALESVTPQLPEIREVSGVAEPMPLTFDVDGQEIESYRLGDPQMPGRELLVEFVPSSLAQLAEIAAATAPDAGYAARNALDGILSSIPRAAAMIEAGMTMRVVGPPEALAGLAAQSLELVTSGGETLGLARDVGSGQFAAHLRFSRAGMTPAAGALAVFQVMSVVTGQYYLHRIDSKLSKIQSGVDRIIRGQQAEAFGKVETAARLNEQVRRNLFDGIPPNADDRHTLDHAEQLVLSAYGEVKHNLSHFVAKLKGFVLPEADRSQIREMSQVAVRGVAQDRR